jgi:hypothetical protein
MSRDFPIGYKRTLKDAMKSILNLGWKTPKKWKGKCDEYKLALSEVGSGDHGGWHNPSLRGVYLSSV